jgi:hypothetical protein
MNHATHPQESFSRSSVCNLYDNWIGPLVVGVESLGAGGGYVQAVGILLPGGFGDDVGFVFQYPAGLAEDFDFGLAASLYAAQGDGFLFAEDPGLAGGYSINS